jgi:hypothetical protein
MEHLMRRSAILIAAALALAPGLALAADQDFTLVNHSGKQVDSVYVSKVRSNDWEEDVMGRDTLDAGESVDISFSKGERACKWDLKVEYHGGGQDAWPAVNLCDATKVVLFRDKGGEVQARSE